MRDVTVFKVKQIWTARVTNSWQTISMWYISPNFKTTFIFRACLIKTNILRMIRWPRVYIFVKLCSSDQSFGKKLLVVCFNLHNCFSLTRRTPTTTGPDWTPATESTYWGTSSKPAYYRLTRFITAVCTMKGTTRSPTYTTPIKDTW